MPADALPKFDAPPVIETALSIQFARLPEFTTAMAGWFWKTYLQSLPGGSLWNKITEASRLEDQFEKFDEPEFGKFGLKMSPVEAQRTQIIRDGDERMIQVQDSRFVLNWRKRAGGYPSFEALNKEFSESYPAFESFVAAAGLGPIEPNQWEVIYVNHIPKGDLWESPLDWEKIIPATAFPPGPANLVRGETLSSDWRFNVGGNRGRLYVGVRHARVSSSAEEILQLTLTARGPIDPEKDWTASEGFNLGHKAIVHTFTDMTSQEAHKRWKRRI